LAVQLEPQLPLTQAPARQALGVVQALPVPAPQLPPSHTSAVHWLLAVQLVPLGRRGTQVLDRPQ
jgi:hypothetical protein